MTYADPNSLVTTDWALEHLNDPNVVFVEVDVDTTAYDAGHLAGAIGWNWQTQLCDTIRRDIVDGPMLESLLGESGIGNDTTIVLYGDNNNWFACWAFWQLKMYGHQDVRIMDGGRKKWEVEGRLMTTAAATRSPATYRAAAPDASLRAFLTEIKPGDDHHALVDVRSPDEFTGKVLAPPGMSETCQRGGHIPGASNIPWASVCNEDGTFKSAVELRAIYAAQGVTPEKEVVTYCRIGERSSHSWFVLRHLLGFPRVRNYDGSWTEWGNLVGAPIETGN